MTAYLPSRSILSDSLSGNCCLNRLIFLSMIPVVKNQITITSKVMNLS